MKRAYNYLNSRYTKPSQDLLRRSILLLFMKFSKLKYEVGKGGKRVGEMQVQRKKEGRKGFLLSICSSSKGSSLLDYRFSVALELLCRKLHQALCSALLSRLKLEQLTN